MKPTIILGPRKKQQRGGGSWGTTIKVWVYPTDAGLMSVQEMAEAMGWKRQIMQNKLKKYPCYIREPRVFKLMSAGLPHGYKIDKEDVSKRQERNRAIIREWAK